VVRVKRTRNPDVVFLERLEHFLRDSDARGVTVLLAGVRPDFSRGLSKLHFAKWLPGDRVFLEDDEFYSATLKAVRHAYELLRSQGGSTRSEEIAGGQKELYYLV
jgi:SulP family sulfate permease